MRKVVCLLVCILLLTGCSMRGEYSIGINKDKSVDLGIAFALDNELIDLMLSDGQETTKTYTDDERWQMLESSLESEGNPEDYGFTSSRYTDGDFKGMKFTKNIESIDSLVSDNANLNIEDLSNSKDIKIFSEENGTYTLHLFVDEDSTNTSGMSTDFMEANLVITLPNEPISHNATSVSEDGKTLTWDLVNLDEDIQLQFKINTIPWNYIIFGGLALVIIIALIVVLGLLNKNKKNKKGQEVINNPVNSPINIEPSQPEMLDNTQPVIPTDDNVVNINLGMASTDSVNNQSSTVQPSNNENIKEEPKTFSFDTLYSNQPTNNRESNNEFPNQNNNL